MIMITSDDVFEKKKRFFFTHLTANGNAIYAPL